MPRLAPLTAPSRTVRLSNTVLGEITGYIMLWGSPEQTDSYGTWADRANPPNLGLDFLPIPLIYQHSKDPTIARAVVGSVTEVFFDDLGIGFNGLLDRSSPHFNRVLKEIQQGKHATSSGTAEHLVNFDTDGRFVDWLLAELSLTDSPAESRMPVVQLIRSAGKRNALAHSQRTLPNEKKDSTMQRFYNAARQEITRAVALRELTHFRAVFNAEGQELSTQDALATLLADGITPEEIMAIMQEAATPPAEEMPEERTDDAPADNSNADFIAAFAALVNNGRSAQRNRQHERDAALPAKVPAARNGNAATPPRNIRVTDKYAHLDDSELALAYMLTRSAKPREGTLTPSNELFRALATRATAARDAGKSYADNPAVRSTLTIRADEVMQADLVGFGDEWVYDLHGTSMWEDIRNQTPLYDALRSKGLDDKELPQGWEGEDIQVEGADPTWYVAGEASNYDTSSGNVTPTFSPSKVGTGKVKLNVAKLSVAILMSEELNEDSIISIVPEAQRKIQVTAPEQIESILLNGDTALGANVNINAIDDTPAAAPNRPAYSLLNGMLKLPLVTFTAGSMDALNMVDEELYLRLFQLLPVKLRQDRSKLLYVVDSDVAIASSNISSFKTRDTADSAATLFEGAISSIWKIALMESAFMGLANTAGKVAVTTPANNIRGRLALIVASRWAARWKRRIKTSLTYDPMSDSHKLVAHMRWGLVARDSHASKIAYNVKITP